MVDILKPWQSGYVHTGVNAKARLAKVGVVAQLWVGGLYYSGYGMGINCGVYASGGVTTKGSKGSCGCSYILCGCWVAPRLCALAP